MIRPLPIAQDPAVPRLAELLEPSRVAASIGRVIGVPVRSAVPIKTKYRIGEHVRIAYDLDAGQRRTIVAVRSMPCASGGGLPEDRASNCRRVDQSALALPDLEAWAWPFPHDRRMAHIDALLSRPLSLARVLEHRWVSSRLVAYTPEKAVVVVCLDKGGGTIAFAKQYRSGNDAREAFRVHHAIATTCASEALRLPRALGMDPATHVVVTEAAQGRRGSDSALATNPHVMKRLGQAVAELHAIPAPAWMPRSRRSDAEAVRTAVSLLGRAMPTRIERLTSLGARLAMSRPVTNHDVTQHGDLHLKNVLLDDHRTWLIDLDQAARGPAEADLGSFAALLRSQAAAAILDSDAARRLEHAFLDGYAAVRRLPTVPAFEWYVAAAILSERALRAVTRLRWPLLASFDALLDEAFAALDKAGAR